MRCTEDCISVIGGTLHDARTADAISIASVSAGLSRRCVFVLPVLALIAVVLLVVVSSGSLLSEYPQSEYPQSGIRRVEGEF